VAFLNEERRSFIYLYGLSINQLFKIL